MYEDEKLCYQNYGDDCKSIIEKFLTLCLPVTTTPCVRVGKVKTECCGNPIISARKYDKCCDEMKNGSCKFTIIQKMKVEIPVDFDADTKIDDLIIDCEFKYDKFNYDTYEKCEHDKYELEKKYCEKCDCERKDC